jgi:hypothetical protein
MRYSLLQTIRIQRGSLAYNLQSTSLGIIDIPTLHDWPLLASTAPLLISGDGSAHPVYPLDGMDYEEGLWGFEPVRRVE